MADFEIDVSYSQIAVFDPEMDQPFNDWGNEHVAQGFAWRPHTVSFATLESGGKAQVTITLLQEESFKPKDGVIRAIQVPFTVTSKNEVEISSIANGQKLSIPSGEYRLIFETGIRQARMWCWFTFKQQTKTEPIILLADSELAPPDQLLMKADAA